MKFYKETRFKDSEIGEIPNDWEIKRLEEIANIYAGNTAPQKEEYFKNGKCPFVRMQHLNELYECKYIKRYDLINEKAITNLKLKLFKKNSILIPKSGESIKTEKKAILPFDGYVVNHLAVIEPKIDSVLYLYLFYYFLNFKISNLLTKTTTPSINLSTLKKINVIIPPLEEQKTIAEILSDLDQAIETVEKSIKNLEKIKKGLMKKLLTEGIGHKKFKKTEIGEIPEDWEIKTLSEVAEYINGYAFSPKDWKDTGLPIIRIQNLNNPNAKFNYYRGEIDPIYIINNGDLLFSWSGSIGIYIWNRGKAVLNQHIFKVIPKEKANKLYLYYALFLAIEQLKNRIHGSTMKHFKKGVLKRIYIPLPPVEEQKAIAEILTTIDKAIELKKQKKEKLQKIKKKLMDLLLTGKIRVKTC